MCQDDRHQSFAESQQDRHTRSVPVELVERYLEMTKAVTPLEAAQDLNNRLILDKFDKTQPPVADKREAKSVGLALAAAIGGEGVPRGRAALRAFAELSQAIHIRVADQLNLTDAILRRDKKATNTYASRSNKLTLLFAAIDPVKAWTAIDTMSFQDARALVNTLRRQVGKGTFFTRFEGIESVKRSFIAIVVELKAMLADKLEDRAYVRKTCRDILRDRPKLQQVMGNLMETRYGLAPVVACMMLTKPHRRRIEDSQGPDQGNCLPRIFSWTVALAAGFTELLFQVPK